MSLFLPDTDSFLICQNSYSMPQPGTLRVSHTATFHLPDPPRNELQGNDYELPYTYAKFRPCRETAF